VAAWPPSATGSYTAIVFNLQGGELVIILLLALVVLGPEKLPDAMRKMGQFYGELRKMSTSFQREFKAAVDEPMKEVRDTANLLRDSADFRKLSEGERTEKPKSAEMAPIAPADPSVDPTTEIPVEAALEAPSGTPVDLALAPPTGQPTAGPGEPGLAAPTGEPSPIPPPALPNPFAPPEGLNGHATPNGTGAPGPPPPPSGVTAPAHTSELPS
jgi:sec-independent protein translocase protein TatB